MKLYATINNDRKTEGLGSNEELTIRLNNGNNNVAQIIFTEYVVSIRITTDKHHIIKEWEYNKKAKKCEKCKDTQFSYNDDTEEMELCDCPSKDCPKHPVEYPLDDIKAKKQKSEACEHEHIETGQADICSNCQEVIDFQAN